MPRKILRKIKFLVKSIVKTIRMIGQEPILVIGDSHVDVFRHHETMFSGYFLDIVSVIGASVSGLENPNSVTQAFPLFERAIRKSKAKLCIVLLGEVDTGFVIWYRARKHGLPVEEMLEKAVSTYSGFLDGISRDKTVICISAPLPTILDGQDWGEVANKRKEIDASLVDRTRLTVQLNRDMQEFCHQRGHSYISLDSVSLGENGVVKESLLNKSKSDHHYDQEAYLKILKPSLRDTLQQAGLRVG